MGRWGDGEMGGWGGGGVGSVGSVGRWGDKTNYSVSLSVLDSVENP
ncbi:hypothetical protein [Fortiea contorta]|nr:hypothetical protein [Fortiea contorta]